MRRPLEGGSGLVSWAFVDELPLTLGVTGRETSTVVVGPHGLGLPPRTAWQNT